MNIWNEPEKDISECYRKKKTEVEGGEMREISIYMSFTTGSDLQHSLEFY